MTMSAKRLSTLIERRNHWMIRRGSASVSVHKESLCSHPTEKVSDEHPPDMHGRSSPAVPDRG